MNVSHTKLDVRVFWPCMVSNVNLCCRMSYLLTSIKLKTLTFEFPRLKVKSVMLEIMLCSGIMLLFIISRGCTEMQI